MVSPVGRQGTIRSVTPEQLHLFRHLVNPRLTTSHQQFHEGASTTSPSYQRIPSYSSGLPTPLSPGPPYPFRAPGTSTGPLGTVNFNFIILYFKQTIRNCKLLFFK